MKTIEGVSARVFQFKALSDNYYFVVEKDNSVFVIDPTEAGLFPKEIKTRNWKPLAILNTHHHYDHVGGNLDLQEKWDIETYGSLYDQKKKRIPGQTKALKDGDSFSLMGLEIKVLDVGAHTMGHIAYWIPEENWAFVGDSLFSLGCGRLFEGQPRDLAASLIKLSKLPDETKIFCAHEYTQSNLAFHEATFPEDPLLSELKKSISQRWEDEYCTVPTSIAFEKKYNPFLRWDDQNLTSILKSDSSTSYLTQLRGLKDKF